MLEHFGLMECTVYQYKRKNQCTECVNEEFNFSEETVNNLVGDFVDKIHDNSCHFRPWLEGFSSGVTLKFKHPPPNRTDIVDFVTTRPSLSETKDNYSLLEFSPKYAKDLSSIHKRHTEALKSDFATSPLVDKAPLISNDLTDAKVSPINLTSANNNKGTWCTNVSVTKNKQQKTSPRKCSNQVIKNIKKKYNVSDHHRGKWVIDNDGCCASKISVVWKEICRILKCGQLPYCNAKYQKPKQEVWIYCDVISSLDVRIKLKTNHKLNIVAPISYWIHPYGAVLKL